LTEAEVAAIACGRYDDFDPRDGTVARTVAALVERSDLTADEYRAAVAEVGEDGVFELLTLVGYYATLALQLRVFRVGAPDGDGLSA